MGSIYDRDKKIITIDTANTTYQMGIGPYGHLLHLYYGKKAKGDFSSLLTYYDRGFSGNPFEAGNDRTYSMDVLPQEYPCFGNGDYRFSGFSLKDENGVYGCDLRFADCFVKKGKYSIKGLPAVYDNNNTAETVVVTLVDGRTGVNVILYYGVIPEYDIITRAVKVVNNGKGRVALTKVYSGMLDFVSGDFDVLHFHGRHGMERNYERTPVIYGIESFGSMRGTSSHQHNPFVILADKNADEDKGDCYAMSLLYSGNFHCEIEKDQFNLTRFGIGIQDDMFEYSLLPKEEFNSPEVAISYADGLTKLSQNYHALILNNICRGKYKQEARPILINNWEATYFDFNGDKIESIAKMASELGVDMLVLDDGWYGKRESDDSGLGDWIVNEGKLQGTMKNLADNINKLGMKFGIWIEPEMVSEDSDLYRSHPDWAFTIPGRKPVRGRYQLVLDFSRKEVVDHVFNQISTVIENANIEYIKMDMNRSICDVYTATKCEQNQGRILYEYVIGVYDFLERLLTKFPDLLIEGCSGGGGRFDAGMLYYTPQIWCSDNTDAIERIEIQYGTSFGYPLATVGAHVSAVPNHQTGRITDIKTRGTVAMAGTFGYELDLNKISDEEKEIVKQQIKDCKKYWQLTHGGLYYRLTNPTTNREYAAWESVSKDKSEALLSVVTLNSHCNAPVNYVKLKGLEEAATYIDEKSNKEYTGAMLMYGGYPIPADIGEYKALQLHFVIVHN
jgi:alpha-galactosidase